MTFHKYLKIKIIGHDENAKIFLNPEDRLVVQEKIDGANFRFMIAEDGSIRFGSRTQELEEDKEHQYQKNFDRCIRHVLEKTKDLDLSSYKDYIFYGECCIKHSIAYKFDEMPPFLGFDIFNKNGEEFLDFESAKKIFNKINLSFVPILWDGIIKDFDGEYLTEKGIPQSAYYEGKAEGVVIKNVDSQIYAKYVTNKFKEVHSNTFGGSPKFGEGDTAKFCLKYCTNSRIDKAVFKMIDDGETLDMPLMAKLPKAIWVDIWEEEMDKIINSKITLDFNQAKRTITRRCLMVLKQLITNNSLQ